MELLDSGQIEAHIAKKNKMVQKSAKNNHQDVSHTKTEIATSREDFRILLMSSIIPPNPIKHSVIIFSQSAERAIEYDILKYNFILAEEFEYILSDKTWKLVALVIGPAKINQDCLRDIPHLFLEVSPELRGQKIGNFAVDLYSRVAGEIEREVASKLSLQHFWLRRGMEVVKIHFEFVEDNSIVIQTLDLDPQMRQHIAQQIFVLHRILKEKLGKENFGSQFYLEFAVPKTQSQSLDLPPRKFPSIEKILQKLPPNMLEEADILDDFLSMYFKYLFGLADKNETEIMKGTLNYPSFILKPVFHILILFLKRIYKK